MSVMKPGVRSRRTGNRDGDGLTDRRSRHAAGASVGLQSRECRQPLPLQQHRTHDRRQNDDEKGRKHADHAADGQKDRDFGDWNDQQEDEQDGTDHEAFPFGIHRIWELAIAFSSRWAVDPLAQSVTVRRMLCRKLDLYDAI